MTSNKNDNSDILTNWQQYRQEMIAHPRLTHAEEQVLVDRALQGDEQAKHEIVQACLGYVTRVAQKYGELPHDDLLDLVAEGNLALVEYVDRALTKEKPFPYLMKVAASEIKHYVWYRSSLISRNNDKYPMIYTESLDAPINDNGTTLTDLLALLEEVGLMEPEPKKAQHDGLYQAVEQLTERQKYIVKRHFGMDGLGPETLGDISRRLSSNPAATLASVTLQEALKRLRNLLRE
jgi:RNA polymerase sporulation-specific sigma factor